MHEDDVKTEYKYIYFEDVSNLYRKRKTSIWDCHNNSGIKLGVISWNASWRQYCFYSEEMVYSARCLDDITDFIEQLMAQRKKT